MLSNLKQIFSKGNKNNTETEGAAKSDQAKVEVKKKEKEIKFSVSNWYADKYFLLSVQRAFLFFFATISALVLIVALIVVKAIYEQKSTFPYLVTTDNDENVLTLIESESHEVYTAQESIKTYFIVQYLKAREGFDRFTFDDEYNLVRILSEKFIFENAKVSMKSRLSSIPTSVAGKPAVSKVELDFKSIAYQNQQRATVDFVRRTIVEGGKTISEEATAIITFKFLNLDIAIEDRRENPLGFQVINYIIINKKSV